jgi:hypothetical protein
VRVRADADLGFALPTALTSDGCDFTAGSPERICASNGRLMLSASVCKGAP